jgi:hypothetical protein
MCNLMYVKQTLKRKSMCVAIVYVNEFTCVCIVVSMCVHGVQENISSNDYVQDVTFVCVYISGA